MTSRLRLLLTVLLVGGAVLMMHVETSINRPDGHHAAAHHDHEDCDSGHCSGQTSHLMALCSMILVVLGAVLLSARHFGPGIRGSIAAVGRSVASVAPPLRPPFKPPDLAVLSVMRC